MVKLHGLVLKTNKIHKEKERNENYRKKNKKKSYETIKKSKVKMDEGINKE